MKMIPRTKIETSYIEILRSWKNEVEEIQKIEDFFKKKLRVDKVFLTSSARYGFLRLLLYLKNVKKAKKVIFPSYTTPIMPRQAIKVDLNISFERINKNDFCLLTKKNYEDSIIVATHIHGNPVKIDELKSKNCIIVEDCAHSLFSKYKNRPTGSFGDFGIFSISPTKLPFPLRFGFVTINDFNKKIEKFFEPKISNSTFPKAIFIGRTIFLKAITSRHIFDLLTYRFLKILSKKKDKLESLLFEDIGQKRIEKLIGIPNLEIIKKCWKRTKKMLGKREYYKKIYEKKLSDTFKFQKKTERSKVFWTHIVGISKNKIPKNKLVKRAITFGIDIQPNFMKDCKRFFLGSKCRIASELENLGIWLPVYSSIKRREIDYICEVLKRINYEEKSPLN